ncbi:Hypothetical protein NTJ_01638 [Nesidiocoris tenuis]|uniref:Uncharacterized protein n=1 Tax=Nesidiocoris tenuis TaxID=355587 RepID=A0ABN7ADA3_9HEMI|nr:Hypothetical protein NTJ_01638 [Nesidiocoris tenuis]
MIANLEIPQDLPIVSLRPSLVSSAAKPPESVAFDSLGRLELLSNSRVSSSSFGSASFGIPPPPVPRGPFPR